MPCTICTECRKIRHHSNLRKLGEWDLRPLGAQCPGIVVSMAEHAAKLEIENQLVCYDCAFDLYYIAITDGRVYLG